MSGGMGGWVDGWVDGWIGGWMGGWCVRYGGIRGRREKVRGVYRFSSLVKQNKKAKICFVIYMAGFYFFLKKSVMK